MGFFADNVMRGMQGPKPDPPPDLMAKLRGQAGSHGIGLRQLPTMSVNPAVPSGGSSEEVGKLRKTLQRPEQDLSRDRDGLQGQSARKANAKPKESVNLLTLPPELRNQIWRMILLSSDHLVVNPLSGAIQSLAF